MNEISTTTQIAAFGGGVIATAGYLWGEEAKSYMQLHSNCDYALTTTDEFFARTVEGFFNIAIRFLNTPSSTIIGDLTKTDLDVVTISLVAHHEGVQFPFNTQNQCQIIQAHYNVGLVLKIVGVMMMAIIAFATWQQSLHMRMMEAD